MPDDSDSIESLLAVAQVLVGEQAISATLQQVVDLAVLGVSGCSMAGITLLERSGPKTTAASSETAGRVDATQYQVGSGPCLDAYRRQVINRIESTDSDERWPEFCGVAAAEGVHSTLSFPLIVGGDGMGALNLYSPTEHGFDDASERMGTAFATQASVTLANARAFWAAEELRANLELAMLSRGVIEQAKGILMVQGHISADTAFDALKRASQRSNRKVHDIAEEIVERASGFGQTEPETQNP